ncbi:MAG TPA: hypothetical protein VNB06_14080 [Thermoanaerobaculia bacterium]|nr:hypothetical protein [Thermoanaerobaculia bacterium]
MPTILPGSPITEQPEASDEAWVEGTLWIPAGVASYEIASTARLAQRAELLALTPHMHSRGTGAEIELLDRDGGSEPLRYYNSLGNPANPDPQRDVPWGRQTSDEMASVFVTVAVPTGVGPGEVFAERNDR